MVVAPLGVAPDGNNAVESLPAHVWVALLIVSVPRCEPAAELAEVPDVATNASVSLQKALCVETGVGPCIDTVSSIVEPSKALPRSVTVRAPTPVALSLAFELTARNVTVHTILVGGILPPKNKQTQQK